jgi:hypothetical protein
LRSFYANGLQVSRGWYKIQIACFEDGPVKKIELNFYLIPGADPTQHCPSTLNKPLPTNKLHVLSAAVYFSKLLKVIKAIFEKIIFVMTLIILANPNLRQLCSRDVGVWMRPSSSNKGTEHSVAKSSGQAPNIQFKNFRHSVTITLVTLSRDVGLCPWFNMHTRMSVSILLCSTCKLGPATRVRNYTLSSGKALQDSTKSDLVAELGDWIHLLWPKFTGVVSDPGPSGCIGIETAN